MKIQYSKSEPASAMILESWSAGGEDYERYNFLATTGAEDVPLAELTIVFPLDMDEDGPRTFLVQFTLQPEQVALLHFQEAAMVCAREVCRAFEYGAQTVEEAAENIHFPE